MHLLGLYSLELLVALVAVVFLVKAGRSWSKLVEAGRSWSKLVEAGRSWSKLVEAGRSWSKLVEAGPRGERFYLIGRNLFNFQATEKFFT
jgi:hypothetical protein